MLGDADGGAKQGVGSVENVANDPRNTVCASFSPSSAGAVDAAL